MSTLHRIPRHGPTAGRLFRRSHALDGTMPVDFGPDTTPSGVSGPPGDWPAAGTLLRPPQVVYLSVGYSYADDTGEWTWTTNTDENLWRAEQARLLGVFEEVKAQIEAARPGRTWVEVIRQTKMNVLQTTPTYTTDGGFRHLSPFVYPAEDSEGYPCNILHFYLGHPVFDQAMDDDDTPTSLASKLAAEVAPRVSAYHERAKLHRVVFPTIDIDWSTGSLGATSATLGFAFSSGSPAIFYDIFNVTSADSYSFWDDASNQQINQLAADLSAYGVTTGGITNKSITVDYLTSYIAEFFGFTLE